MFPDLDIGTLSTCFSTSTNESSSYNVGDSNESYFYKEDLLQLLLKCWFFIRLMGRTVTNLVRRSMNILLILFSGMFPESDIVTFSPSSITSLNFRDNSVFKLELSVFESELL